MNERGLGDPEQNTRLAERAALMTDRGTPLSASPLMVSASVSPARTAGWRAGTPAFKHPGEYRLVRLHAQPSARSGNTGMIRRVLRQPVTEELPQRDRVRAPPRNAALRTDAIHIPDQQHAGIHPRRNARTASGRGIKCPARRLGESVQSFRLKQPFQSPVKRVTQPANVARGWHAGTVDGRGST